MFFSAAFAFFAAAGAADTASSSPASPAPPPGAPLFPRSEFPAMLEWKYATNAHRIRAEKDHRA